MVIKIHQQLLNRLQDEDELLDEGQGGVGRQALADDRDPCCVQLGGLPLHLDRLARMPTHSTRPGAAC